MGFLENIIATIWTWAKNWCLPMQDGEVIWWLVVCEVLTLVWMGWSHPKLKLAFNYVGGWVVAVFIFALGFGFLVGIPMFFWNYFDIHWVFKLLILGVLFWLIGFLIKALFGMLWAGVKRVFSFALGIPRYAKANPNAGFMIAGALFLSGLICSERVSKLSESWEWLQKPGAIPIASACLGIMVLLYRGYQTAFGKRATRGLREKFTRKPDAEGVSRCFKEQFFIDDATGAITMERCSGHLGKEEKVCKKCGWPNANFEACACGKLLQRDSYEKEVHCPDCSTAHPPRYHKSKHWRRIHGGLFRQEDIARLTPAATPALPASQMPAGLLPAAQPGQPGAQPAAQPGPRIRTEEIELDDDGDIVKGAASCWVTEQGECLNCGHAVAASLETCTMCGQPLRRTAAARRADESLPRSLIDFLQETTP